MGFFTKKKHNHDKTPKRKNPVLPDIQVMMLGAQRVGKTSVLASMVKEFDSVAKDTDLNLKKSVGGKAINDALDSMKGYFIRPHLPGDTISTDTNSTQGFDRFDLSLEVVGKKTVRPRTIRFVDTSGEWINNYANESGMAEEIEHSDIIIVAIDSILLMEQNGRYNKQNYMDAVTDFIRNYMEPENHLNRHKMVLFVPLKCEKYYHQNQDRQSEYYGKRMDELNRRIKEEYSGLIGFLTKPANQQYFTVAILPILTLGGLEFRRFMQADSDASKISVEDIQYRYCPPDRFAPEYCAQPLLYTLMFEQKLIDKLYKEKYYYSNTNLKNNLRFSAVLMNWFADRLHWAKDIDYIKELGKLEDDLKRSGDGFEVIQDPIGL